MASVLVDPDDISYMDDVEDDDDISEMGSDKRHKRRKNRILHEALSINTNEQMVKELRQDRRRLLSGQEDDNKDNDKFPSVSMLRELQKDRREALKEKKASHKLDHTDGGMATKLCVGEPTYETLTETNALINEKDKTLESEPDLEAEMVSDTQTLLEKECSNDNKCKLKHESSETSRNEHHAVGSRDEFQVTEDLSKLQVALQKADAKESEKLAINKSKKSAPVTVDTKEEIVKPKQISEAQILMLDEPSTSGTSESNFQTTKESKKRSSKGKAKSKATKEMGGIKIIVTEPQDDSDKSSIKKPNGSVRGKSKSQKSEASPEISDNESSGFSGIASLNFLRRLSEQRKSEGAANDLMVKRAMYEKTKTRPFKKLAKIKSGLFQVGIEGDAKRSYIKAITIMPDKKLVMFDRNNQCLKLYDNEFNPLDRVSAPVKFCGLAPIFDSTLAATFPEKKQLQFYHIDSRNNSMQKERTQTTSGEYYAIAHYENKLYMLHRQRTPDRFEDDKWSIHKMDLNMGDAEPETLRQFCPGHKDNHLCVNSEGLYMTNKLDGDILHLAHDGTFKGRGRVCKLLSYTFFSIYIAFHNKLC